MESASASAEISGTSNVSPMYFGPSFFEKCKSVERLWQCSAVVLFINKLKMYLCLLKFLPSEFSYIS